MGTKLTRRAFMGRSVSHLGAAIAAGSLPSARAEHCSASRPNLLFVFSDQHSADMLGCYGNSQIITPNFDRLAAQGVRFNHCLSSSPLCTPYRGLLLSGRHTLWNGTLENDVRMLPGNGTYFAEVLRDAGYTVGYIGKWHLYGGDRNRPIPPGPYRYGFDGCFLTNNCTLAFDAERAYYWDENGRKVLYGDWEPYAQARQAVSFIEENAGKPFALFLSWHTPHNWIKGSRSPADAYGAPDDLLALYKPGELKLRANCVDSPANRRIYRGYMAMCTSIDRAFGWLMDALEKRGLATNTIVVYTSDHGDTLMSHGFAHNKMRPEIESIRVPLIIRYPGALEPRVSELLIGTLDLMPTLLVMMALRVPESCHGKDLSRAIRGARDDEVDSVPLFLFPLDWRGVYTRRYTYCVDTSAGFPSLYRKQYFSAPADIVWNCLFDRAADPNEENNLFESAAHAGIRKRLHERTRAWMRQYEDGGLPYSTIVRKVFDADDPEYARTESWSVLSGRLKGRPLDLLR